MKVELKSFTLSKDQEPHCIFDLSYVLVHSAQISHVYATVSSIYLFHYFYHVSLDTFYLSCLFAGILCCFDTSEDTLKY